MIKLPSALGLSVIVLAVLPSEAFACPFCFDASAENRMAFLMTAIALTALPLGMVSGVGLWLRRKFGQREQNERDAASGPDSGDQRGA